MAEFQPLIPGLPEDLALQCLTRIHSSDHQAASCVSRAWCRLLGSVEYYHLRKQMGLIYKAACFIQAISAPKLDQKPNDSPGFGITLFDLKNRTWERVDSIPAYPNGVPLHCHVASLEGKLVVMGGWEPVSYNPTCHVVIYDLTTRKWKRGQDMPDRRSLFAIGSINGRILVAGGHDMNKNALDSAWAYDVAKDKWNELTRMTEHRDECQGMVVGPEFWVISGYGTEAQGEFKPSADIYNIDSGSWKRFEGIWTRGQSPRSCVGFGSKGELINWAKSNSQLQSGKCTIDVGEEMIVYDAETLEFFIVDKKRRANVNGDCVGDEKLDVPNEFLGFVQSGCCVEI